MFIRTLLINFKRTFTGGYILFHIAAIGLTYAIVSFGIDWQFFLFSREYLQLQVVFLPAIIIGGIVPVIMPGLFYLYARARNLSQARFAAFSLAQTVVIGLVISSLYKIVSGRMPPGPLRYFLPHDISANFHFGFLQEGVVDGWPSGHTTIAFAMSIVLIRIFANHKFIAYSALLYCFYIGLGVATNIHWFSDFVAGALIGTAIGLTVSRGISQEIGEAAGQ